MKQTDKLLKIIPKLDAVQFTGLARILKVKLVKEVNPEAENAKDKYEARDFLEVLAELLQKYEESPRARRREIL